MEQQTDQRTWTLLMLMGCIAALMGLVAVLIDWIQGDPFNPVFLVAVGAGLLVAALALRQRRKTPRV